MNPSVRLLLLEIPGEDDLLSIIQALLQDSYTLEMKRVSTKEGFQAALSESWDGIIAHTNIPTLPIFAALALVQEAAIPIPCIVVSEPLDEETAVDIVRAGAYNYVLKGNTDRLIKSITQIIDEIDTHRHRKSVEQELRKSEVRYRIISDLFSDYAYAFRLEPDGTLVNEWVTDAFSRVTGYTVEELAKLGGWEHLIYPEDMPIAIKRYETLIAGKPDSSEFRIVTKDGSVRWLREHGRAVPGKHNSREVLFIYSVAQDITNQKQAETELQHSQDRFHTIFHVSPLPIVVCRLSDTTIIDVNKSFLQLVDQPRDSVIGHTLESIGFQLQNKEHHIPQYIRQQHALYEVNLSFEPIGKSRRLLMAWMEFIELHNETGILTILHDHTEQKYAQDALRQERDFINTILDTEDALVAVFNPQGQIVRFNRACESISGYTHHEILHLDFIQTLIPQEERESVKAIFQKLLLGHFPITYEGDWVAKDGTRHRIAWSNTILPNDEGQVSYIIGTGLDITERRKSEERIQQQIQRLAALRRIQMHISATLDQHLALTMLLDHVLSLLEVAAGMVLLTVPHSQVLEYTVGKGFSSAGIQWTRLRIGEGCAGRVALERRPVSVPNITDQESCCIRKHLLKKEGLTAYYGVPLIAQGKVKGVLELFHHSPIMLDQESQNFLEALAGHTAVVIDNAELVEHLQRSKDELTIAYKSLQQSKDELTMAYNATIEGWARAMELRDAETEGHSRRVTDMTIRLAQEMGIKKEHLVHIYRGAILHDIGKMAIPDSILLKNGPLTEEERDLMGQHPIYAYQLLKPIAFLEPALKIPYYHHERWDGTGYPDGLQGTQIPLEARIFAVVDVWDALSTDRPYRKAWDQEKVFAYIQEHTGSHFDPHVVEVFCKIMGKAYQSGEHK